MAEQPPYAGLSIDRLSTSDRAAEELRRAMFAGELTPGTPLREVALAEALDVSRPTVREALALLVAEGLADRVPHRGTQVRTLDEAAVHDVCLTRAVLETAGIRAWGQAGAARHADVRAALAEYTQLARGLSPSTPSAALTAAHLDIHRSLVALTGSTRLLALADSVYAEVRLVLASVERSRRNAHEQVHTHGDLLQLVEAGRTDEAVANVLAHLAHAEESMLEANRVSA